MPNNKETILETKETLPKETSLDYIEEIPVAEIPNYLQGVLTRGSIQGERIIGTINVTTVGHIRGGQTAYNTDIGFFLGYSTDAYKLSIGNPAGNYLTWDNSLLTVKGKLKIEKLEYIRFVFSPTFESLDGWYKITEGTGASSIPYGGMIGFRAGNAVGNRTIILMQADGNFEYSTAKNPFFQCRSYIGNQTWGDFIIGGGSGGTDPWAATTTIWGFEWNKTDAKLYAMYRKANQTASKTEITGINIEVAQKYSIEVKYTGGNTTFYYYINDVLQATKVFTGDFDASSIGSVLALRSQVAGENVDFYIQGYLWVQDF